MPHARPHSAIPALSPAHPQPSGTRAEWVNDVHSELNATLVAGVLRPRSIDELAGIVRAARGAGRPLAIAGGRHAMGGQQFATGELLVDMTHLDRVLALDLRRGVVEVEGGILWPALVRELAALAGEGPGAWSIVQKQTGADRLSLGGALSANVHGRGLALAPIVGQIEAFTLVDAEGEVRECSRGANRELFALAIGGYGLFGIVGRVRLRLAPRRRLVREVELCEAGDLARAFEARIAAGALHGDFQFAIDPASDAFLREGILCTYHPVADATGVPAGQRELDEGDWRRLLRLAHGDKTRAFREYAEHYLATRGRVYSSDAHQLGTYVEGYHREIDAARRRARCLEGPASEPRGSEVPASALRASEVIGELFVPRAELSRFLELARADLRRLAADVIYGTVRLVEEDRESFLAWAREPWACVVFNLCTPHTRAGRERTARAFQALIARARGLGGSFYLTYHRYATREQLEACHPRLREFFRAKRELDPEGRFQSDGYRHHVRLLGLGPRMGGASS